MAPTLAALALWSVAAAAAPPLFEDDFERGLGGWEVSDPAAIKIVDSGDAAHGKALLLAPGGARLHALIHGSEGWPAYRIEGELGPGSHRLLLRVRGGQYATGGFFARLVPEPPPAGGLDCPPVPGAGPLLERAEAVLVGELHGTAESPTFVAALACRALAAGKSVTVGFELAESEEGRFSAYLGSDGGPEARAALLAGPPWQATGSAQYGATSEAMLGLLEELRRLRRQGHPVSFALFNRSAGGGSQDRDRRMAETVTALIERSGSDLFLALTGNIHSKLTPGTRWDPEYEPMGYLVRRARPELALVSLDVAHTGGSAWLCTPEGCGERRVGPHGQAAGERFAIGLGQEPGANGHHGSYSVGEIHASPPAVRPADP